MCSIDGASNCCCHEAKDEVFEDGYKAGWVAARIAELSHTLSSSTGGFHAMSNGYLIAEDKGALFISDSTSMDAGGAVWLSAKQVEAIGEYLRGVVS